MILAISMKQALSTICYMMTATTTDAQIAEQVEKWYPSRAGANEYTRVYHMGKHCRDRLQKAAEVCESYLRQHYNEETILGRGVLKHADVLEELACNFQEVWDDDKVFRSGYKPFVRTALLE